MSKAVLLLVMALPFAGCTTTNTYALSSSDSSLSASIDNATVSLEIGSLAHPTIKDGVATSDCITISDSASIVIDGVAGHVVTTGGMPFDGDSCTAPTLATDISPRTPQLEIAVVVEATTLHMELTLVGDSYQVTRCGAASCDVTTSLP